MSLTQVASSGRAWLTYCLGRFTASVGSFWAAYSGRQGMEGTPTHRNSEPPSWRSLIQLRKTVLPNAICSVVDPHRVIGADRLLRKAAQESMSLWFA